MNQLNKLLKPSPGRDISRLLTTQPCAQPAAGSSRLGFTGLLLSACSLTRPSLCHLAAQPVPTVLVLRLGRGRCAELSCGCRHC